MQFIGNAHFRDIDSGPKERLYSFFLGEGGKPNTTTLKRKRCDKSAT